MDSLFATLQVDLHTVQHDRLGTGWRSIDTGQPYARLYALVDGEAEIHHHGRHYPLRPGWLYVIPRHTPMSYRCHTFMDIHWVHFNARVRGGLDLFACLTCDYALPADDLPFVCRQLTRLKALAHRHDPAAGLESLGIMAQLLAPFVATASDQPERLQQVQRFQPVLDYMEEHLNESLRIPDLARLIHLEPTYFTTLFGQLFGMPPLRYLHHRRVERALGLLWRSDDKLDRIAAELGYHDAFHFSRTFKAITGSSPSRFRHRRHPAQP